MAPLLALDEPRTEGTSLQAEIARLCEERDEREGGERITLPAPPSLETLRMATPCPPREERSLDTIPAPPPSAARKRTDAVEAEGPPSTIPGPPRVPRIIQA